MLILQRKTDESLLINGNIELKIVEINGDRVKLAINAPREIPIIRSELLAAADANREAIADHSASLSIIKNVTLGKSRLEKAARLNE